ncbi:hypothetical protein DSO57_1038143 [Entomophthora muscae]|uniref:Uncharacterized protein n=1 Tax=Entomophthora muscae TaxID=34485 RepID=A0ACC2TA57_9FUNG|nr:hypothetical protein DSO57_1038143 [Entomophthora muscae]
MFWFFLIQTTLISALKLNKPTALLEVGGNSLGKYYLLRDKYQWSGTGNSFGNVHQTRCSPVLWSGCVPLKGRKECYTEVGRELWVDKLINTSYVRNNCFLGYCENHLAIDQKPMLAIPVDQLTTFNLGMWLRSWNTTCTNNVHLNGFAILHRHPRYSHVYLAIHYMIPPLSHIHTFKIPIRIFKGACDLIFYDTAF